MTTSRARSRWRTKACVLVLIATTSACVFTPGPPANMKGDVPLRIINASHGTLCYLRGTDSIYASEEARRSWLAAANVEKGRYIDFKVKPGSYEFSPQICDANGSRLSTAQPVTIRGPTELVMGDEAIQLPPQAGFQRIKARFMVATCSSYGFSCDRGDLPCCSGMTCARGPGGGICRWK